MQSIQSAGELFKKYIKSLAIFCEVEEAKSILFLLLEEYYHLRKSDILMDKSLNINDFEKLENAISRLKKYEPIQHILGYAWFYGEKFVVNKHVLIPRQETEELVSLITKRTPNCNPNILDIGTGSGVIAITLKKQIPEAQIIAWDISSKALQVSKENAKRHNTEILFELRDILSIQKTLMQFDVIVSNPPYVTELEKINMTKNVLDFDPPIALFVSDNDPLIFYRHIISFAKSNLKIGGKLYFEINERLGEDVCQLFDQNDFSEVALVKDISGKDRIVFGKYN